MEIDIQEKDTLPIYEQIVLEIKKAIIKSELHPGEMLPSIRSLARSLGISVITTKRAYEELEKSGIICSIPGKGFYVQEVSRAKLTEDRFQSIENKLEEIAEEAKEMGICLEELQEILEMMYERRR